MASTLGVALGALWFTREMALQVRFVWLCSRETTGAGGVDRKGAGARMRLRGNFHPRPRNSPPPQQTNHASNKNSTKKQPQEKSIDASQQQRECPTCEGRGVEVCACTRWSDGDAGCASCQRTGMMACRSCGGGGVARPIKVAIRRDGR
jgi:hypothetical protein